MGDGSFGFLFTTIRRGFAHLGELLLIEQILFQTGILTSVHAPLYDQGHFLGFVLYTLAGSALTDLFVIATKPESLPPGP